MVAVTERVRRKIRRAEYDRMVEVGSFQHERLELIRGELVESDRLSARDGGDRTVSAARSGCPDGLVVRCQQPLICADESEPEPDRWTAITLHGADAPLVPAALPDLTVTLAAMVAPRR